MEAKQLFWQRRDSAIGSLRNATTESHEVGTATTSKPFKSEAQHRPCNTHSPMNSAEPNSEGRVPEIPVLGPGAMPPPSGKRLEKRSVHTLSKWIYFESNQSKSSPLVSQRATLLGSTIGNTQSRFDCTIGPSRHSTTARHLGEPLIGFPKCKPRQPNRHTLSALPCQQVLGSCQGVIDRPIEADTRYAHPIYQWWREGIRNMAMQPRHFYQDPAEPKSVGLGRVALLHTII